MIHRGGGSPLPFGILKREEIVEVHLSHERQRRFKVLVFFAGESDDDIGSDTDFRAGPAERGHFFPIRLNRVPRFMQAKDPVRSRLNRQMNMLTQRFYLAEAGDQSRREVFRVRGREPDPFDSRNMADCADQVGEIPPVAPRLSVRVYILPQEGHFTNTRFCSRSPLP